MKTLLRLFVFICIGLISCKKEETPDKEKEKEKEYKLASIPDISTSEISATSATITSTITDDGGTVLTDRGICWSLANTPTINDSTISSGTELGTIDCLLSNLQPNTKHFVRVYAINSAGISYSAEQTFTTLEASEEAKTEVKKLRRKLAQDNFIDDNIVSMSFTFTLTIADVQASDIVKKGICWSYSNDCSIEDNVVLDQSGALTADITLDSLPLNNSYIARGFVVTNIDTFYGDKFYFGTYPAVTDPTGGMVYKPNIYLYPTETTDLQVRLSFPKGGSVVTSIPDYRTGWDVTVDPDGRIDKEYTYLFYESEQPDEWQKSEAWIIKQADLQSFFETNMKEYGFEGQEIVDFTDYWIPRFTDKAFYVIYPQEADIINTLITLSISEKPENILRLFYVVHGYETYPEVNVETPRVDNSFKREGYFVTEWGVIL